MFVILEGQIQARGDIGGETVVISIKPGDVTGVLPFSRMKQFPLEARATTDTKILRFPSSLFPELVQKMPELTKRLVGLMADRIRETTRMEQQRDRLASRGFRPTFSLTYSSHSSPRKKSAKVQGSAWIPLCGL